MRALEVCSGIGGLALGLELAGWEIAGLCEADPRCRAELAAHWPQVPILTDLTAIGEDELHAVGPVDLLAGGIPCQPWSHAGKRRGRHDERDLWPAFLALAERTAASCLLIENVPGLASDTGGADRIAADLEARGYAWWACRLRAADVGAPHLRDRFWICAVADDARLGRREGRAEPAGLKGRHDAAFGGHADRALADLRGQGRQGRRWTGAGAQRAGAERDGAAGGAGTLGHTDGRPAQRRREPGELRGATPAVGRPGDQRQRSGHSPAATGADRTPWSDAVAITCRDGKTRLVPGPAPELALQPLADGLPEQLADRWPLAPAEPGRVARLRAIGNGVVPLQAYVPARALLEVAADMAREAA